MEMDQYDPLPIEDGSNRANVSVTKKSIGGKLCYLSAAFLLTPVFLLW